MSRKAVLVFGVWAFLLLVAAFSVVLNVPVVSASGTIYIRADGSIEPPTAPISTVDNITYTFTDNIYDEVVIERSNIIIDGNGYALQGSGSGNGFYLYGVNNVTIKKTNIEYFHYGVQIRWGSNNTISGNNITNSSDLGVWLEGSNYNTISENNITNNNNVGLYLGGYLGPGGSSYNIISGNNITKNRYSFYLSSSSYNEFKNNSMVDNFYNFDISGSALSHFVQDVDTSNTVEGKPVYYWINRRNMEVPLDAGYVALVNSTNITVKGLELKGILLAYTTDSQITNNNITNSFFGVKLRLSSKNNTISRNNITDNSRGVDLSVQHNNTISRNTIAKNEWGIYLSGASYNTISGNIITENANGVGLGMYSNNNTISGNNITDNYDRYGLYLYYSSNNTVFGNTIANNNYGLMGWVGDNNKIYHNNFIDNTSPGFAVNSDTNTWDNGYPSGGNYWSNYAGVDVKSGPNQDQTGSDGIGDTPQTFSGPNEDKYPLMDLFNTFDAGTWNGMSYSVDVVSNSTVSDFYFNPSEGAFIRFNVTGKSGTNGFCRVTIPKSLLWVEDGWTILVGGTPIANYTIIPDENYTYLYFTYNHSTKTVVIQGTHVIPEFPPALIPPILIALTLITIIQTKSKTPKKPDRKTHL